MSICGDGIVEPGEECDDGNNTSGDGCSADCKLEHIPGINCNNTNVYQLASFSAPVIFRDFKGFPEEGGHPDFEHFHCPQVSPGLLSPQLSAGITMSCATSSAGVKTCASGVPAKPAFAQGTSSVQFCGTDGTIDQRMITSADTFGQWYVDTPGVNKTVVGSLTLTRGASNTYVYDSDQTPLGNTTNTSELGFFPLDSVPPPASWGLTPPSGMFPPDPTLNHDYGFTTEFHNWFTYQGGEALNFSGDDDVWVFINHRLALDLGGTHDRQTGTVTLDDAAAAGLGLSKGTTYEMALFHAERHTTSSNFELTLGSFVKVMTTCASVCGDGIKAPDEQCDDGPNNGKPGDSCTANCQLRGD
ncbi:MAG TPA: fibro-slime domain-containing protein [Anaeromyxobacteraceae bacterium]|nr:fibro-slime domain-containing protein [Anaeromyxobacteraceae bacterium]